jgi:hypothetical protein
MSVHQGLCFPRANTLGTRLLDNVANNFSFISDLKNDLKQAEQM